MIRRFSVLTALIAVLFAAGCARDADSPAAQPATPIETGPTAVAPTKGSDPSAPGGQTITGTVTAGVEPNCILLNSGGTDYLLIVNDATLREQVKAGAQVTVVGTAEKGMMTTCQQGTPFTVTAVRPN